MARTFSLLFALLAFAQAPPVPGPINGVCPPVVGLYSVILSPPSGTPICGSFDSYSFTISNSGFIQIRTHFVEEAQLSGPVNGINTSFLLPSAPSPTSSLHLFRNGLRMKAGVDYILTGNSVTFASAPQVGDLLLADYRH